MSIWNQIYDLKDINIKNNNTIVDHLNITIDAISENTLTGSMPVDKKTKQPFGLLHGGASCVLAETIGSIASNLVIDSKLQVAVGQSINASHIRPANSGRVHGTASVIHMGRTSHIWNIEIFDDHQKLICTSRLTMAIITKKKMN